MKTKTKYTTSPQLRLLKAELGKGKAINEKFDSIYENHYGDWKAIIKKLEKEPEFKAPVIKKLEFTYQLSDLAGNNEKIIALFKKDNNSTKDIALKFNKAALIEKIKAAKVSSEDENPEKIAYRLHNNLFKMEPTASLKRMLADPKETPVPNKTLSGHLATFLTNQPDGFNLKKTSIYEAFKHDNAFKDIDEGSKNEVVHEIKALQRVVVLSPTPEALPALLQTNMTSAYRISEMSEKQFVKTFSSEFEENGEAMARQLHVNAINSRVRNEQALIALKDARNGTGVDFIDKSLQVKSGNAIKKRSTEANAMASYAFVDQVDEALVKNNLSWDMLFNDADLCECGACNSVYSAAAYFVELLQYLRNNNLDPHASGSTAINPDPKDISGTPLEQLFARRPDLGCLQLTCKNTNTVLPYIDLVNEVMENYIVYHYPKPFNVSDETTGELLAQPQNTEYEAYCILHKAVYPFTLPYHQPIDVARTYLNQLETSRHELIDRFRSVRKEKTEPDSEEETLTETAPTFTETEQEELDKLHTAYIDRAVDAEYLGLTQEEYVILTKEAFVSKTYWDKQCKKEHTDAEYLEKIGVKPTHAYYGYGTEEELLDADESAKNGLSFVKKQFLRRTGINYLELVELLKTQCLNPNIPTGRALSLMQGIGFSYRFLQSLVDNGASTPKAKYQKLVDFLNKTQPLIPLLDALINPDPCGEKPDFCDDTKDLEKWVHCYFESVGKIIVLENGISCVNGKLVTNRFNDYGGISIATIQNCQIISAENNEVVGTVDKNTGKITLEDASIDNGEWQQITFISEDGEKGKLIKVKEDLYLVSNRNVPFSVAQADNCNLETVRLIHLDGSPVTIEEYDKIQRFIRLWIQLGWTIDEVDKALVGLGTEKNTCQDDLLPDTENCGNDCDDLFETTEDCEEGDGEENCGDISTRQKVSCEITPSFLHQLVAVKKLLDTTGLELIQLLTFWSNISTSGEKSLYKRLFLKYNLKGIDKVFIADENGNYLTKHAKISEHMPVVMAALHVSSEDLRLIMEAKGLEDKLNLHNLSVIYRCQLLSKSIGLKLPDFVAILPLFGSHFTNAHTTLNFIENWAKMEDAGFNYRQLNYVIRNYDDPKKPQAPTQKDILLLAKTIYDGLNAIDEEHKNINEEEALSIDTVLAKSILLFPQAIVDKLAGLLEGTNQFTTNAPKNLSFTIPDDNSLENKLLYNSENGHITITGILTLAESTTYQTLSNTPLWQEALVRIEKQQAKLFKEILFDVFETEKEKSPDRKIEVEEAEAVIKEGDINIPFAEIPEGDPDPNTTTQKARAFMKVFLPYLRDQLTNRFIVETLSQKVGLEPEVTSVLISTILEDGTPTTPIYAIFESIKESAQPELTDWSGYLIPPTNENYTFVVRDSDTTPVIILDGIPLLFAQQEDPTNEWWSTSIPLQAGNLYHVQVAGKDMSTIFWKAPTSSIENIPSSLLLPDFSAERTEVALIKLEKTSIITNTFEISADELLYFHQNASDFSALDFNALSFEQWLRLESYVRLRDSLPKTDTNILDFFSWAKNPDDPAQLSAQINALTLWEKERIDQLIHADHFDLNDSEVFYNEVNLLKLQKALEVADKIEMDIDLLFDWAKPTSNFKKTRKTADSIQHAIRAKYQQEDWEQVVKPLNDIIRNNQEDALIAYCLQLPDLISWGVTDADGLFEYFLIDVQMDACMETSRIKQALSSVQLFVQRCFLGLEEEHSGIAPDILDSDRWEWMQRYRVWEANRKVFLYPENWIESNLRDDKTPFFKELESELLQNDINKENVVSALKSYLYKVDEVANMEVVGIHIEGEKNAGYLWSEGSKLHIFSRTRNAPYLFYYRYLALDQMNWYPWAKIEMDIPVYDVENDGEVTNNGCYLTPFVWRGRLLLFFPQIMKKTKPADNGSETYNDLAGSTPNDGKPIEFWEIKMGWSELRNGKWTQKQLSKTAIYDDPDSSSLSDLANYEFAAVFSDDAHSDNKLLGIKIYYDSTNIGTFEFNGTTLREPEKSYSANNNISVNRFHYNGSNIKSLQVSTEVNSHVFNDNSFPKYNGQNFHLPHAHVLLGKIGTGKLDDFFKYNQSIPHKADAFGAFNHDGDPSTPDIYHELKKPYSLYNWEVFFHTPMMLANALSEAQQFEEAMKWHHYVFKPIASGSDNKRFWQFSPFKETDTESILDAIFKNLEPNESNQAINEWRSDPFKPHLVARSRPVAYMKWVVMKYLDNLIAWGDYLFRQDTIESLNQATQLYILAHHIIGRRPYMIPKRGEIKPQTYNALLGKWDAFSNAMVELELTVPFSNQTTLPIGIENGVVGFANLFGFSSSLYFCIPNNPKLMGYWDTIDDRLFKIRHCQNIEGVFRKLPLFEPPIDPALLVKAAAQGLSIASVLNDLNTPMPNYRFYYLLQKSLELCSELKSLGGAMLSAIEKKDNEVLGAIKARHEGAMQNLVMEIKKQQLEEAQKSLDSLYQNRKSPEQRMKYYLKLVGEDANLVPGMDSEFTELVNTIEAPVDESGLKLIKFEKEDLDKASNANDKQKDAELPEKIASILHIIPNFSGNIQPFGIGMSMSLGGSNFGAAAQAFAKFITSGVTDLSFQSSRASKKGGFLRSMQDRIQQANAAGLEVKQIDKQILAQQIRIDIANQEIANQQQMIDHSQEVEAFITSKYTNEELYTWMKGNLRTLYHQTYTLAYELAKKAEKAYGFESGLSASNFIQSGYWNAGRDGLLAGEQLYVGLKKLEATYQDKKSHDYEITKHVSLRQISPLALVELKETGKCEFYFPEILFDMDYPGHYKRRIKSVSISIPCIVGPYTGLNATLRLLENKFRNSAIAKNENDYIEKTEESDERFMAYNIPITAIAASSSQNESGVFELNFKDERYLPFEGAGVISKWRLELPEFRQFDYETISDAIVHVRYMANEGGERMKKAATDTVLSFNKNNEELGQNEGLFSYIDLKHDLSNAWHKAMAVEESDTERVLDIDNIIDYLPYYVRLDNEGKLRESKDIKITDMVLTASGDLQASELSIVQEENEVAFTDGKKVGNVKTFAIREEEIKAEDLQLKIKNVDKVISKAMLILRFILK